MNIESNNPNPSNMDVLSLESISKSFGGVHALSGVSFSVKTGEIHALVGENGAGKSTLIKIAAGAFAPDSGNIIVAGQSFAKLTPHQSRQLGIAVVYQHFNLLPDLSVAENIYLSSQPKNRIGLISTKERYSRARQLLERIGGHEDIDPRLLVRNLKVAQQQIVEIAKALATDAKLFILDEPSAVLPSRDLDKLFSILRLLRREGHGIIYISHRLEEIFEIADRVTVLKDGEWVVTKQVSETNIDELVHFMVGRPLSKMFPAVEEHSEKVLLKVENLSVENNVYDVSFTVNEGEVVGFAGLGGSGKNHVGLSIVGLAPRHSGLVQFDGQPVPENSSKAAGLGIVLVPEDRTKHGLVANQSMRFNITLPSLKKYQGAGLLDKRKEKEETLKIIERIQITPANPEMPAESLSGGNQQKVVIGKWLLTNPRLVIFNEPTRGIDVGAKVEIYQRIRDLTRKGVGVILSSSELPELIGMCDRILVFRGGKIAGELKREEFSEEAIMYLAAVAQTEVA